MGAMGRQDFRPIWLPTTATLCNNFGIYCIYYIYHWHVVNKLNLNLNLRVKVCVESVYGFLNGWPNLKPYWLAKWEVPVSKWERLPKRVVTTLIPRF